MKLIYNFSYLNCKFLKGSKVYLFGHPYLLGYAVSLVEEGMYRTEFYYYLGSLDFVRDISERIERRL